MEYQLKALWLLNYKKTYKINLAVNILDKFSNKFLYQNFEPMHNMLHDTMGDLNKKTTYSSFFVIYLSFNLKYL